jgi:MurNAc alpha-1-phosphate uridylyltransferase
MQCVILAGGLGTRLGAIARDAPKALVQVAGRPFADHQLALLAGSGVTEVVYCIGHLGDRIRDFARDGSAWGLRIEYVDEDEDLRGTAGALRLAFDAGVLEPSFAVLYGDSYLPVSIPSVWRDFQVRRPDALMAVFRNEGRFDRSNAVVEDGWVKRFDKGENDPAGAGMSFIDYGLSILDRDAVVAELPAGEVIDLADVYGRLSSEHRLAAYEVHERFYEVGSQAGLADLEELLAGESPAGGRAR